MRRDLTSSLLAVVALTALLGLAYPLIVTGLAQVAFPGKADGSRLQHDGRTVGSRLVGQEFAGRAEYFQSRPSPTEYAADATAFSNAGPNSHELRDTIAERAQAYLRRERRDNPGLTTGDLPPDAVMTSASGIDPHISPENARIQSARVARVRGLSRERVDRLVAQHTHGRGLGVFGEPGVNVLELNLALDREAR
jgi:K+-transporting ATPase ATPase C chain